jgi:predicted ATPase
MPLAAGSQLGRYVVGKPLGEGGMGEVYRAWDAQLERVVALKILPHELASDPLGLARFVREARSASALNHPNIITVYEIGHEDSTHFIAMEFVDGVNLRERVARGRMHFGEIIAIAAQVASALASAHQAGIVHRDVKPENLMLRKDGYVKVLDFGVAKPVTAAVEEEPPKGDNPSRPLLGTRPGTLLGTVPYMSPEQAQGLAVDTRSDVWSFGIVLYELIAGRRPYWGPSLVEVVKAIVESDPVPLERIAPDVPPALAEVVTASLRKRPAERTRSMSEIAAALDRMLREADPEGRFRAATTAGPRAPADVHATAAGAPHYTELMATESIRPPRTNLLAPAAALIGRERELREIGIELRREGARIVTLTGPGGTGKTRLALQAAAAALDVFPDGVFFVDLSAIDDPSLVPSAVAQVLGIDDRGGGPLLARLAEYVRGKNMLLVLDNFEQILDAAPVVAELATGSRATILVTSRASLRLRAEREYAVPPLAVPALESLPSCADLARYDSVALFLERARDMRPGFSLTEENCRAVAEICVRLDGLPLAIELAVARLKVLSPQSMVSRLEQRLALLTDGARDLPHRQQTLRAEIAWSFDLLEEREKALFARLSVFAGGFTLEAAEAVCGNYDGGSPKYEPETYPSAFRPPESVLDGLGSLVNKSLLRQRETEDGDVRFGMLLTIREYGLERFGFDLEAESVRRRHANYFLEVAERVEPQLRGPRAVAGMARLDADHDNLRAALAWSLENEPEMALRIAASLKQYWDLRGYFTEGLAWFEKALARSPATASMPRARALQGAGLMLQYLGDYERARPLFEQVVTMARSLGDKSLLATGLSLVGAIAILEGDYAAARTIHEETLRVVAETEKAPQHLPIILSNLGEVARAQGEFEAARAYYEQSLAVLAETKNPSETTITFVNLGYTNDELGEDATALEYHRRGLALAREIGDLRIIATVFAGVASIASKHGRAEKAARLLGAAESLMERFGAVVDPTDRALHERTIDRVRAALGDEGLAEARAEGRAAALREAVAEALDLPIPDVR